MLCGSTRTKTKRSGSPCRARCLPGRDHCIWHGVCQGTTAKGKPCGSRSIADFDFCFCSAVHDPSRNVTPVAAFRIEGLHKNRKEAVMEYRGGKDAYTNAPPSRVFRKSTMELDHVVEIHSVRNVYDQAVRYRQGSNFDQRKRDLLADLKEGVNETSNLNLTAALTNAIKFQGIDQFEKDYQKDVSSGRLYEEQGIFPYLVNAQATVVGQIDGEPRKLSRKVRKNIQEELYKSFDALIDTVEGSCDDSLHDETVDLLHRKLTAMRLK